MAMQLPYKQKKQQAPSKIPPLRMVEHPNAFGAHLEFVRNREGVTRSEVADALPQYFEQHSVTFPTSDPRDMYRKLEKGIRAVRFEELIPLYATLIGCGIRQSTQERHTFVRLARLKLETLRRKRPKLRQSSEWEWLEAQLAKMDQDRLEHSAQNALDTALSENAFDISHVVGRADWLKTALSYLHTTPPKKLVVVQAMMGMGKTTCLKLLLHTLCEGGNFQPILHLFSDRVDMTAEDHLDTFLATILAKREVIIPESKMPNRREQIKLLLSDLHKADQRVVLLLDDAQIILDEHGQLAACWQDFFTEFLQRPHQATIYLATREWSMWPGRDPVYIVDGDQALLAPLSGEAGLEIWRRFGFGDVDAELLRRATERFGGNPRMIELQAMAPQRRKLPFAWEWGETASLSAPKSEHQELIEHLLEDSRIFGPADTQVQHLLEHVVSEHISSDALPILEVLAISPLALPFPLLVSVTPQARYALVELLDASLLDQTAIANQRAGVQPLTREAVLHTFLKEESQRARVEQQVSQLYQMWMDHGTFRDGQEQAQLIAEVMILYLKQNRFLEGAELIIRFGWLCSLFGQVGRIQRMFEETTRANRVKDLGDAYEAGRVLLSYHLIMISGERVNLRERDRDFHVVRELCLAGKIILQPSTEISLAHYLTLKMIYEKRYQYAYNFLQETFDRISARGEVAPEDRASFLHSKSNLLAEWGNAFKTGQPEESKRLYSECVTMLTEAIHTWELCLSHALPVQEHHYHFKIAKALNDLACYSRILGYLEQAEQAIIRCLELKEEKKASSPSSLAISYGEFAQILAAKGQYNNAEVKSDEAIRRINTFIQSGGDPFAIGNKGTLLFERAQIYELQGRLSEAYQLA